VVLSAAQDCNFLSALSFRTVYERDLGYLPRKATVRQLAKWLNSPAKSNMHEKLPPSKLKSFNENQAPHCAHVWQSRNYQSGVARFKGKHKEAVSNMHGKDDTLSQCLRSTDDLKKEGNRHYQGLLHTTFNEHNFAAS
jgi:hypothetical protein